MLPERYQGVPCASVRANSSKMRRCAAQPSHLSSSLHPAPPRKPKASPPVIAEWHQPLSAAACSLTRSPLHTRPASAAVRPVARSALALFMSSAVVKVPCAICSSTMRSTHSASVQVPSQRTGDAPTTDGSGHRARTRAGSEMRRAVKCEEATCIAISPPFLSTSTHMRRSGPRWHTFVITWRAACRRGALKLS